jgi:hypothetical protein
MVEVAAFAAKCHGGTHRDNDSHLTAYEIPRAGERGLRNHCSAIGLLLAPRRGSRGRTLALARAALCRALAALLPRPPSQINNALESDLPLAAFIFVGIGVYPAAFALNQLSGAFVLQHDAVPSALSRLRPSVARHQAEV